MRSLVTGTPNPCFTVRLFPNADNPVSTSTLDLYRVFVPQSMHLPGFSEVARWKVGQREKPRRMQLNFPRPLRWICLLVVGLAVLLAIFGISYQAIKGRADALRFHEDGRLVDLGGYRLNIDCTGKGSLTVILEAGIEVPAKGWRLVQPGVASFTRVCSYDRAGYGWSDSGPMPRKLSQIVLELHTLLQNAGEKPP